MILSETVTYNLLNKCDLRIIAAMSLNGVIGLNNNIPWQIPEELKFFRSMTINSTVLMGRKTFQSIGRLLPNRKNVILTHSELILDDATIIHSIEEIFDLSGTGTIWICGGASIYQILLPACRELYLSIIHKNYHGDTFFPDYKTFFGAEQTIYSGQLFHVEKMINKKLI